MISEQHAAAESPDIPLGLTDTLIVTLCDDRPWPEGFDKVIVRSSASSATMDEYAVLGRHPGPLQESVIAARNYLPVHPQMTLREFIRTHRPSMRVLSFRPIPRTSLE